MPRKPNPLHFLLLWFAGMASQALRKEIDYLRAENRILKAWHGRRRVRMTDDQRRHLADLAKALGRKALANIASVVMPDTVLRREVWTVPAAGHLRLVRRWRTTQQ